MDEGSGNSARRGSVSPDQPTSETPSTTADTTSTNANAAPATAAAASTTGATATVVAPPPPAGTTASDLFNRQVDLQKIEFLNGRVLHLQAENETLRDRHDKREQETHEFVAYFQKEIQTRDKQLTKLTEELASLKLNHALELEASQQSKENESQQLQQHFSSKEEKFTEQLFFLKEQLTQLEAFKEMKETIHSKMKDVENQLHNEKQVGKEQIGAMERKFLEEKARLQKDHEKRIEIVKQQAKEDARNGLDADTRKIVTDNRRMGEELRFQLQMTDELQKEKDHFEAKAKKCWMELQISTAKEQECAAAAQRQAREIRQLRATISELEKRMSESLSELEREKFVSETKNGKELDEMTLDVDGLRRLVKLKNKELRNLRRLAQLIVDQRTEVEVFFLDALAFVKDEIDKAKTRQHELEMEKYHVEMNKTFGRSGPLVRFPKLSASGPGSKSTTTSTTGSGNGSGDGRHFSDKIDIRQLTWEDKERVLRLVFAKINGVQSLADATPQMPPPPVPSASKPSGTAATTTTRRQSANQEPATGGPAVYFATEPSPSPSARSSTMHGVGGSNSLSMSLSGLPLGPSPPPSFHSSKHK